MAEGVTNLNDVCSTNLLSRKWLIAPSYRVGHQWIESLVRSGQPVVNLTPTTAIRLALELAGPELAEQGLTLASPTLGPLIIDSAWNKLPPNGYLGRLKQSAAILGFEAVEPSALTDHAQIGVRQSSL